MNPSRPAAWDETPVSAIPGPIRKRTGWPWIGTVEPTPALPSGLKEWPRISIVTASFNQGDFIEETIRSVLLQRYPNLEYVICDGGSTDETVRILERYDRHLTLWVSEKDGGAADALKKGFARTTGSIVAYLNSDDVYLPGTLFKAAQAFARSGADLVYGNTYWVDPEGEILGERRQAPCFHRGFIYGGADILQPAAFWTKAAYDAAGGIDPSFRFHFDLDLFYRFVRNGNRFQHLRSFLTRFRIHPESKSCTLAETYAAELDRIRKTYLPYSVHSLPGKVFRNLGRLHRAVGYTVQGDLPWLLGRIPDRFRSRRSGVVVGPRTKWI